MKLGLLFVQLSACFALVVLTGCGGPSLEDMRGCTAAYTVPSPSRSDVLTHHEIHFYCSDGPVTGPIAFGITMGDAAFQSSRRVEETTFLGERTTYFWSLDAKSLDDVQQSVSEIVFEDDKHRLTFERERTRIVSGEKSRGRLRDPEEGFSNRYERFSICLDDIDEQVVTQRDFETDTDVLVNARCFFMSEK